MKKLIIVGVFMFAFALTANMAFACVPTNPCCPSCPTPNACPCPQITISNVNDVNAHITTSGTALTGGNTITVPKVGEKKFDWFKPATVSGTGTIWSGNATVSVGANNTVGFNQTQITSTLPITVTNYNNAKACISTKGFAGTGNNVIKGAGTIGSGAGVTSVSAVNVVGSNLTIIN